MQPIITTHGTVTARTLALPVALTACAVGLGLAIASPPDPQLGDQQPTSVTASQVTEDDPGWNCYTMGNGVCGDPAGTHSADAWNAWDMAQGWRHLPTPDAGFRVEYVGDAHHPIVVGTNQVAIPGRGQEWYLFRAVPDTTEPTIGYRAESGE